MRVPNSRLSNQVAAVSLAVIATIAFGWFLHLAQSIIVPIVLGGLLALLMDGVFRFLDKIPLFSSVLPAWVKKSVGTVLLFFLLVAGLSFVVRNLDPVVRAFPGYFANLDRVYFEFASQFDFEISETFKSLDRLIFDNIDLQRLFRSTLNSVSYTAGYLVLVFLYAVLFTIERESIAAKITAMVDEEKSRKNVWITIDLIVGQIGTYFMTKTLINIMLGFVSWGLFLFFGIEFAGFFAFVTAVLNYVPYIGSLFAVALPMLVAVGTDGLNFEAFALLVSLSAVQFGVGYLFEPRLMGKSMNLSPVVVVVSLASWAAIWGPIGAILSVVLTSGIMTVLSLFGPTRPIAILLTNNGQVPETQSEI